MKSTVQTRIFISLTPDEARAAVNDAIDLQLCVRSALYQIDGAPVATLIEQNNHRRQLAAPAARNGHAKPKSTRKTKPASDASVECPECHEIFKARGLNVHIAHKHRKQGDDAQKDAPMASVA